MSNHHPLRTKQLHPPLPAQRLEKVAAWGGASSDICYVYRPSTVENLEQVFDVARQSGRTVGFRGAGNSYGDAALNGENILVDLRRMNRILAWDPRTGVITVEPGVTLEQLWEYIIEDGWWPPVVTGTSKTSVGGCAAMNVHGKNDWQVGPIGDHILSFEMMLPSGEIVLCNREENADVFYAAIGGFGMLGCFTAITMRMKRIYSGLLRVEALVSRNLGEMLRQIEETVSRSDYTVGWVDAFALGKGLGRGQIHLAHYLPPETDPYPRQTLRADFQRPPSVLFGVMPASTMWLFMRPFWNNLGTRLVNEGKFLTSRLSDGHTFQQAHASFHFLLDYIPDWKKAYGPGGLIQYQSFIPAAAADSAFSEMLRLGQRRGLPNYLSVLKRHRPDDFLMTHNLDGFSLAMDFRITRGNRADVVRLTRDMDEIVLRAGGRFYFAKDSTLRPEVVEAYLGQDTLARFRALKARCDPEGMLETNLWRRLFGARGEG
ncbi:MAG: FAD-binding oxidoreductase [Anaerolineales bacterium]|nr:FAD-binding oxidoreductase [Anaerolineales bacterium]MCB8951438.1 FAD-binding oxidoreductase [Ardenticatenales bacterium]